MPRKKKRVAKSSARKSKSINLMHLKNLEQEIFKTPDKISAQLNKLIMSQKKKEAKLNKALNKVNALCRKLEGKLDIFNEADITPAIKKRINKIKKNYAKKYKEQSQLDKEINQTHDDLNLLNEYQEKYKFLGNYLVNFKNEWKEQNKTNKKSQTLKSERKTSKNQKLDENYFDVTNSKREEPRNSSQEIIVEEVID